MRLGSFLRALFFPPKCLSCGELFAFRGTDGQKIPVLCDDCEKQWKSETLDTCAECGRAVSLCTCPTEELRRAGCGSYRKLVYYRQGKRKSVPSRLIYRMKNTPNHRCTAFLAEELLSAVKQWRMEDGLEPSNAIFVYIPRGKRAEMETGTDQAKQLARALSEQTGIPLLAAVRRKIGKNRPQKQLKLADRRRNAKEAYRLAKGIRLDGKTVILVDDVVTTGATAAVVTKLLRRIGAERILCLSVASNSINQSIGLRQPQFHI